MKPEDFINFSAVSRLMAGHHRSINKGKLHLVSEDKRKHIQDLLDYVEKWAEAWERGTW